MCDKQHCNMQKKKKKKKSKKGDSNKLLALQAFTSSFILQGTRQGALGWL